MPQNPNSVPPPSDPHPPATTQGDQQAEILEQARKIVHVIPLVNTTKHPRHIRPQAGCVLLRKEVIQPHLPVRLPCYDFVPIASPTFDGSPHKG